MNTPPSNDWHPPGKWLRRSQLYTIAGAAVGLAGVVAFLEPGNPAVHWDTSTADISAYDANYVPAAPAPEYTEAPLDASATPPSYESAPLTEDPTPPIEDSPTPASSAVASRESEATLAGYDIDQAWSELNVPEGQEAYVDVAAQPGQNYLVLARSAADCDVDVFVTDEIKDDAASPDASVLFHVTAPNNVHVRLPVRSSGHGCTLGVGVYRSQGDPALAAD
jgi:hypothetical protein